jgi:histidinol dehydrogenase
MVLKLKTSEVGFAEKFAKLLTMKRESSVDVNATVAEIVSDVQARGDAAVIDYTAKFDGFDIDAQGLAITTEEMEKAFRDCDKNVVAALEFAHERIKSYHERQKPHDDRFTHGEGIELGHKWTAIEAVGLYVPGGLASYPSSVLMNAVPAKVAGVKRLVMVMPTPRGKLNSAVLVAASLAGVSEIYRIGGAQAIAALAYGTDTIIPVAKIVGPGNAYVAAAKRQVFGIVGIDMIAGPSEVLVLADKENDPAWIAADLLAQAEHDTAAQSILISDDETFALSVEREVARQLKTLPNRDVAGKSWADFGTVIIVDTLDDAVPLIDNLAPEHLELACEGAERLAHSVTNAGAIFIGRHTPEAIGDYVAGPNHVLPTARSARFSSGLNVLDFMKRTSLLKCTSDGLRNLASNAIALAESEGLDAHARSIAIRINPQQDIV